MPCDPRQTLGKSGEDAAIAALTRRGYAILARRYRTRLGEIDIVARDGDTIVFVEVKARSSHAFGHPAEAVASWKRRRLLTIAVDFLARHRLTRSPCRFDVVAITTRPGEPPVIEVIRDAFQDDEGRS